VSKIVLGHVYFFALIMTNYLFCAQARVQHFSDYVSHITSRSYHNTFYAVVTAPTLDPKAFQPGTHCFGVNSYDDKAFTPLHRLVERRDAREEYVEFLLARGADPLAKGIVMRGDGRCRETPYEATLEYGGLTPSGREPIFEDQRSGSRGAVECIFSYELEMRLKALVIQKQEKEYAPKRVSDYYSEDKEETKE